MGRVVFALLASNGPLPLDASRSPHGPARASPTSTVLHDLAGERLDRIRLSCVVRDSNGVSFERAEEQIRASGMNMQTRRGWPPSNMILSAAKESRCPAASRLRRLYLVAESGCRLWLHVAVTFGSTCFACDDYGVRSALAAILTAHGAACVLEQAVWRVTLSARPGER